MASPAYLRAFGIVELAERILFEINDDQTLFAVAMAIGPAYALAASSPTLARRLFVRFERPATESSDYGINRWVFPHLVPCGHTRFGQPILDNCRTFGSQTRQVRGLCPHLMPAIEYDAPTPSRGLTGLVLPGQHTEHTLTCFDRNAVLPALRSGDAFLDMHPSRSRSHIKLVVTTPRPTQQNPPNPATHTWAKAEIVIWNSDFNTMLELLDKLYRCAEYHYQKVRKDEMVVQHDDGQRVQGDAWKCFFSPSDLRSIVSFQPKYYWNWTYDAASGRWN